MGKKAEVEKVTKVEKEGVKVEKEESREVGSTWRRRTRLGSLKWDDYGWKR